MAFKRNVEGQKKIITLCLRGKSKICVWERARETQTDGEDEIERRERERCRHRQTCILINEELFMNVFGFLHSVVIVSAFVQMTNQNNTIACRFIDVKMMFLYIEFD